mmetsp:Transcript_11831/g.21577  ORF Transcript_11831/g.21577 Transcript_11831/m.21577 type:complete len:245 (-) Transcript_11831:191-925(-)
MSSQSAGTDIAQVVQDSHAPVASARPLPVLNTFIHFDSRMQGAGEVPTATQSRSLPASPVLEQHQRGGCSRSPASKQGHEADYGSQVHCSSPPVKNTFIHYTVPPSPDGSDGSQSAQSVPRNWCPAPFISKGRAQGEVPTSSDAARQEPVVISLQQAMPTPPGASSRSDRRQPISLCLLLSPEAPSSMAGNATQARLPSGCDQLWGGQNNIARQLFANEGQGPTAGALTWEQQQAWHMYSRLGA